MFTLFYHYCTNLMHTHTVCIEKKQIAKLQHYEVDNVWQMSSVWKAAPHLQTYQTYWLPKRHSSIRFGIISYPCHISQNSKIWDVHLCVHKTSIVNRTKPLEIYQGRKFDKCFPQKLHSPCKSDILIAAMFCEHYSSFIILPKSAKFS